jgi:MFS family permease
LRPKPSHAEIDQWTFLAFFLIFELGSVLCAAANSSNMLIVGRAVAGFGAAGIMNGSFTIVAACAPLEQRPRNAPSGIMVELADKWINRTDRHRNGRYARASLKTYHVDAET